MQGAFCSQCGQKDGDMLRPFLHFLRDLFRVVFELDNRAYRTVGYLLTKPGFLTREYFAGRRQSYTPPLRLFLVISIGFFLLISVANTVMTMSQAVAPPEDDGASVSLSLSVDDEDGDGETTINDFEGLFEIADQVELPFLSETSNQNLRVNLRSQLETNIAEILEAPRDFFVNSLEYITFFMLLMMPIMALAQKILWFFTRRYYVEHLVLIVHNQSFLFLMMLLLFITGFTDRIGMGTVVTEVLDWVSTLAVLWMMIYLIISLKSYFQRGWIVTLTLFTITTGIYSVVLGTGIFIFGVLLVVFA